MEERTFHPLDYVSVIRRRKWSFIVPLVVSLLVGLVAAKLWPREYHSEAKIGIAAPSLSPDLLRGLSSLDAVERQRAVSQHLLSTTVLERVLREEPVVPDAKADDRASWMRKRVTIEVDAPIGVSTRASDRGFDNFRLGFKDSTPDRTQRIANKLATVFVEENSKYTADRAENTAHVLGEQLKNSQERLAQLDEQLSSKKQQHMGRLPSMMEANLQMANGARHQLESISQQLSMESSQLLLVESQINQMRQGLSSAPPTSASAMAFTAATSRLNELQQQLAQARANGWTDKHPEVDSLLREIKEAKGELASIRKDSGDGGGDALKSDPVYQQKIAERDAIKARINSLRGNANQARSQIAQFQSRVEAAPMVEQDLNAVQREFDLEKLRYADLKSKYDTALLQGSIARNQGGERFTILYPAGRPVLRSMPPLQVLAMSLMVGFVLGSALALGREFMDRSVHDARALQTEFDVPVLGEIPRIQGA